MCGIYGYYNFDKTRKCSIDLREMARLLHHRGPDGIGMYEDGSAGIGNVRLAIIDPEGGGQPFYSDDKMVVVVQNGEIFNFKELKKELEIDGVIFHTHCDTEVLVHLYLKYGYEFLNKLNGMFSIAIFDKSKDEMFIARDRIGEKPLYFSKTESQYIFSSEIKGLLPYVDKKVNYTAINAYLRLNYVPSPLTAFDGVYHVEPGTYQIIKRDGSVVTAIWWSLANQEINYHKNEGEWISEFNSLLEDSVKIRLESDVPFGAFLSGGVDSTSVVGLMAKNMKQPAKTYSIGFPDPRFDESHYAQMAADRFKTDHHCEIVGYDIVSEWEDFIYHCDQPHGDVSFMPMRKVSEIASKDVKMVLTGDGADELFAGYEKYVPVFSNEKLAGASIETLKKEYLPYLTLFDDEKLRVLWKKSLHTKIDWNVVDKAFIETFNEVQHFDAINKALYFDMKYLLSGNNLVKPDRMAMAESLETRAPFLDYRMMEFAFTMPGRFKLVNGETKYLYKKAVTPLIGEELAYRKKQMFTVPIGEWFRTELSKYCNQILLSEDSHLLTLLNKVEIERMLEEHLVGKANNTREIRALISLELWLKIFF